MKYGKIFAFALALTLVGGITAGNYSVSDKTMSVCAVNEEVSFNPVKINSITYKFDKDHWVCDKADSSISGSVVIESEIEGYPVTAIGGSAFYEKSKITDITIPKGIKDIGSSAFYSLKLVEKFDLPDTVENFGDSAFYGCKALKSIELPDSIKSLGQRMFQNCSALESVKLSNSVTELPNELFWNCTALKSIDIPESVVTINEGTFKGCDSLTVVVIPKNVTSVARTALCGKSLTDVYIYNPECKIYNSPFTIANGSSGWGESPDYPYKGTLWGYEGSTAEVYAKQYHEKYAAKGDYCNFKTIALDTAEAALGDPTGDGLVDANDASFVLAEYAKVSTGGVSELSAAEKSAADVNADGAVDASDASLILAYYAHVSTGGKKTIEEFIKEV